MSERSVLTKSMSWDWVTNGDGAPGRRVARRAVRMLPAARRGLVTVPSFADAGVVRCSPVPHRGFAGGPFQGQGAGPGFGPGAGERHVGSSSSVSDAGRGVPRGVSVLMVILGMRPTVGPPARERIMEIWDLWPAARRAAGGTPGPGVPAAGLVWARAAGREWGGGAGCGLRGGGPAGAGGPGGRVARGGTVPRAERCSAGAGAGGVRGAGDRQEHGVAGRGRAGPVAGLRGVVRPAGGGGGAAVVRRAGGPVGRGWGGGAGRVAGAATVGAGGSGAAGGAGLGAAGAVGDRGRFAGGVARGGLGGAGAGRGG